MADSFQNKLNPHLEPIKRDIDRLTLILTAVVIVLLVGFATMFIATFGIFRDNEAEKQATYQNLINQVQTQNTKIQVLTNQLKDSTVTTH